MLFKTSQRHEEFRAKIREFAESELKPITFMLDKNNEFPGEIVEKLGKMGIMGLPYPKEYGGAGKDILNRSYPLGTCIPGCVSDFCIRN